MSERDDQKARYRLYASKAREWTQSRPQVWVTDCVRVPEHPTVQEVKDGAFVEALIWVPRRTIDA